MPDNSSPGYLEHFLSRLIKEESPEFKLAKDFLAQTKASGKPKFPVIRDQKALVALFLAVQKEPGISPQAAVDRGLFDHTKPLAQNFLAWLEGTFQF